MTHLDARAFLVTFLPYETRRLTRTGVALHCLDYWADELAPWVAMSVDVRIHYDPRDVTIAYVRSPGGEYLTVTSTTPGVGKISIYEWNARREYERSLARHPTLIAARDASLRRGDELVARARGRRRVDARLASKAAGDVNMAPEAIATSPEESPVLQQELQAEGVPIIYGIEGDDDEC